MDNRTLTALRASIAKWRRNARIKDLDEARVDTDSCPLCTLFVGNNCVGCPVAKQAGMLYCKGTPYIEASNAYVNDNLPAFHAAAEAEVAFLTSLLPVEAQT